MYTKNGKIYPADIWKYSLNCEKQVILLIITNLEGYIAKSKGRWH